MKHFRFKSNPKQIHTSSDKSYQHRSTRSVDSTVLDHIKTEDQHCHQTWMCAIKQKLIYEVI